MICEKCNKEFLITSKYGTGRFCSKSCANSRGPRTEDFKAKVSKKLLGRKLSLEQKKKVIETRSKNKPSKIMPSCVVCGKKNTKFHRKTCSSECLLELTTRNSFIQKVHGGGYKGKYKGIHSDSSYELCFIIYHIDHNIPFKRVTEKRKYLFEGKEKEYLPDFEVGGKIYELKGFFSEKCRAKLLHNPDIFIIDKEGIKIYQDYVKNNYEFEDIRDLYDLNTKTQHTCGYCKNVYENYKKKSFFCSRSCSGKNNRKQNEKNGLLGWYNKIKDQND